MSGPSSNHTCIFPFVFNYITYNECTHDADGFWCSTKVDSNGSHIGYQGNWGRCGPNCFKGKDNLSSVKNLVATTTGMKWKWDTKLYSFISELVDGNMTQYGMGNETRLIHSSKKEEDMKVGLVFFVSGFVILFLGILTSVILSRVL